MTKIRKFLAVGNEILFLGVEALNLHRHIFYNQFVMVCDFEVTIFRSIFRADEALISEDETSGMTE